jgi:hypothetical protein
MYLFDTDVLSALAKKRRPGGLMVRLAATPRAAQFTTSINVAEISYGLFKLEGEGAVVVGAGASRDRPEAPPDRRHGQRPQFPGHSGPARRELARVINSALAGLTRIGLHLVLFFSTIEPCGSTWPNSESSPPGAA